MKSKNERKARVAKAIQKFRKIPSLVNTSELIAAARSYRRLIRNKGK